MRGESGSGSVLGVAVVAAVIAVATLMVPVVGALAAVGQGWAAADASALAAADVAVGIQPGIPCESAAAVAASNGARLDGCVVDGAVVTVSVEVAVVGFRLSIRATAGPPGGTGGHSGESALAPPRARQPSLFVTGMCERRRHDRE
ncbi:Rv3654c family TadE-like protein [Lacisediminihabitans sp.]|uniref:Rv3654c family TadE-like protein n=1 Tax=Lacisediminihabitans sp. TaxID=2787631 RepID=UPI00374D900E